MLNIELRPKVNVFIGDFELVSRKSFPCRYVPCPEHHHKPRELKGVVEGLIADGEQIVISTNSYILLKWFQILGDNVVAYHSLFVEDGNLCCATKDILTSLEPNPIFDEVAKCLM